MQIKDDMHEPDFNNTIVMISPRSHIKAWIGFEEFIIFVMTTIWKRSFPFSLNVRMNE